MDLCLNIDGFIYDTSAYVLDIEEPLILGSDFFQRYGIVLDVPRNCVLLKLDGIVR